MEDGRIRTQAPGRFLKQKAAPVRKGPCPRWVSVSVLLAWDGLLLYMIVECLIAPVYGAAFVGIVSVYMGYLL